MGKPAPTGSLDKPTIFLDENHCRNPHLRSALADAGVSFESHSDHFPAGTEDTAWLPEVGKKGWVLLTTDKNIRKHILEKEAVRDNHVRMFYFSTNTVSGAEMGAALRTALPNILSLCEKQPSPFTASINKNGLVTLRDTF